MTKVVKTTNNSDELPPDPRRSLEGAALFWLYQAHRAVRGEILRIIREQGDEISAAQWEVLARLWQRDGASQTALARSAGRDRPGITRLLDGMQDKGLIERRPDPDDRRRQRIYLTAAGRKLHARLLPAVSEILETAFDKLPAARRRGLRDSLQQIHRNLKP